MSELRQDRISGGWVVIAPRRGERPHEVADEKEKSSPDTRASCPFCPGHEAEIPRIVAEYPSDRSPGWSARVVVNRYSAFAPDAAEPHEETGRNARPAFGYQEVVIETPRHDTAFADLSDEEIGVLMRVYRDRFTALMDCEGISTVTLFRNHGPASGASLLHPHAQLVATALRPPNLLALEERAKAHFERCGRCIICDELVAEIKTGRRIVEKTDAFITFVPFAPRYPLEMWIVPVRHQARFDEIDETEIDAFGLALRGALRRLRQVGGDVSYNFVIDSAGTEDRGAAHFHWRLRIAPKFATWGGFELGTDLPMNPVSPEQAADALRKADPGN